MRARLMDRRSCWAGCWVVVAREREREREGRAGWDVWRDTLEGLKYWILRSYKLSLSLGLDTIVSNLFDGIDLLLAKGLVRGRRVGQCSALTDIQGRQSSHGVGRLGCR